MHVSRALPVADDNSERFSAQRLVGPSSVTLLLSICFTFHFTTTLSVSHSFHNSFHNLFHMISHRFTFHFTNPFHLVSQIGNISFACFHKYEISILPDFTGYVKLDDTMCKQREKTVGGQARGPRGVIR